MNARADVAARVSRETFDRLSVYVDELMRWQRAVNLVSPATLPELWTRHIADSLQLTDLAPAARTWVDLGSGGGLPGLVVAGARPADRVTLIESDARKCAFLRHAAGRMGVQVEVKEGRAEKLVPELDTVPDVVTARALAPLDALLRYAQPLLVRGACGLFMKGRRYQDELTAARESWTFRVDVIPSSTDPDARILKISGLAASRPAARQPPDRIS